MTLGASNSTLTMMGIGMDQDTLENVLLCMGDSPNRQLKCWFKLPKMNHSIATYPLPTSGKSLVARFIRSDFFSGRVEAGISAAY